MHCTEGHQDARRERRLPGSVEEKYTTSAVAVEGSL